MSDRAPILGPDFDDAEIALEIGPDGRVRFEISGVPGEGCEELERLLVAAIGGRVEHREHTPEYYQRRRRGLASALRAVLGKK
ncbi:MAG: DUF2997 domain-containing protein [Deltaproteobacteria bacterium]|nr:MAG: DUF2997 domain-containing protein [Deltaproteobacteria bacterium]